MFKDLIKKLAVLFLGISFIASCTNPGVTSYDVVENESNRALAYTDNVPPSQNPPGGLLPSEVPQFVSIGFDDNMYSGLEGSLGDGGMKWAVDMFSTRFNPPGNNPATYDGAQATASFYYSTIYISTWGADSPTLVKRAWREAWLQGHEIGNHTERHQNGRSWTVEAWLSELQTCHGWLTKPYKFNSVTYAPDNTIGIGIPANEIYGFRTPYLAYNDNTMAAVKKMGYVYDCSINEGFQADQDGTNNFWPYTLDNGSPGNKVKDDPLVTSHPGLWEMPVYAVIAPPDEKCAEYGIPAGFRDRLKLRNKDFDVATGKITGLDYNMWYTYEMSKAEYVATLKYTLDLKLNGNRAPFLFGAHTDYYSSKRDNLQTSTYVERQQAMAEFVDYALSKNAVRVTSQIEALNWIKNPVKLVPGKTLTVTATADVNGTVSPSGAVTVFENQNKEFVFTPNTGYVLSDVTVDGVSVPFIGNSYTLKAIAKDTSVHGVFTALPTYTVTAAVLAGEGTVTPASAVVVEGGSQEIIIEPMPGYEIDSVTVDGIALLVENNRIVLNDIRADHVINVTFKPVPTYTVKATVTAGQGTVSPASAVVNAGGDVVLDLAPAAGFEIAEVLVDGLAATVVNNQVVVTAVVKDTAVTVAFAEVSVPPAGLTAVYTKSEWGTGFSGNVTVTNGGDTPVSSWTVSWTFDGDQKITSLWNASFTQTGKDVVVTNLSWNGTLAPGASYSFGFNGTYSGVNAVPVLTVK